MRGCRSSPRAQETSRSGHLSSSSPSAPSPIARSSFTSSAIPWVPSCSRTCWPRLGATATAATRIERLKIYNLDDPTERSDCVTALDNKSLLDLVSNAFEPTTGAEKAKPLLGLAKCADRIGTSLLDIA